MSARRMMLGAMLLTAAVLASSPLRAEHIDWNKIRAAIERDFPGVEHLSSDELAGMIESDSPPLLLDVREPEEYRVSHLHDAVLATDIDMALAAIGDVPRDQPIVVYCAVGYRSSRLATQLESRGYTAVQNLDGSLFKWVNEGRTVYRGTDEAGRVHPYDKKWGLLLEPEYRAPID